MLFSEVFQESNPRRSSRLIQFESLLQPMSDDQLAALVAKARVVTMSNFGKTMRMFAPLYLSNECVNNCQYCGFSRDNPIFRVTLTIPQVLKEAKHIKEMGFRNLLLVAGEHPRFVSEGYLEECLESLREDFPTLGIEVGPMETPEYESMVQAGAEGLVVYQETYDPEIYATMHTAGPKKDFSWRLDCPERGYDGGFRRIGLGALFGLADWRKEATGLAMHLDYLRRKCWKASYTVSFPRLRPAAGGFNPLTEFTDRDLLQVMVAFRLCFPETGIVLSTREPSILRDALVGVGVTHMSAGSHTEPGGYTNAGVEDLHLTVKGRRVELEERKGSERATVQFGIADERTPAEVSEMLLKRGYEPVWKDWDEAILSRETQAMSLV